MLFIVSSEKWLILIVSGEQLIFLNITHAHTLCFVWCRFDDARQRILAKGFTPDQFEECLTEYERLNVWQINMARTLITFI